MKTVDKNNFDVLGNQDHNSPAAPDFSAAVLGEGGGRRGNPPSRAMAAKCLREPAVSSCMVVGVGFGLAGVSVFGDQCCGAGGVRPGGNDAGPAARE